MAAKRRSTSTTNQPDSSADSGAQVSDPQVEEGVALCLSGGGYRAMLFHVGSIIRLNQMGLLPELSRVSSVSGGSITAGVLGLNWNRLDFDQNGRASNLFERFVLPIKRMASKTIDRGSILGGIFLPGSVSDRITGHYQEVLFGDATLQDLPSDSQGPRFVINATNVQSGVLVRMSRPYLADYRVGMIRKPKLSLATAVAASSAFPPVLSPAEIDLDPDDFEPDDSCDLQHEPYTSTMVLSDGGVYDNLGLETAWKNFKTILVSDGGNKMLPEPEPAGDWARHSKRVIDIMNDQVISLRKRHLIDSYISGQRSGSYWGIRTNIQDYSLADALSVPIEATMKLAYTPTRLKQLPQRRQQQIINWGYAVCDAALRKHSPQLVKPETPDAKFPYPSSGVS